MKADALILFNERVDRLDRSTLAKRMAQPNYNVDYQRIMRREWISVDGVTEDDVDAFVLNIRLLIQDGDGFSIRELANNVYGKDDTPKELRNRFDEQRCKWRREKAATSMFKHVKDDRNYTNGELFDILLYGGFAHVNPRKVALFRRLTRAGLYSSLLCGLFLSSLHILLDVIRAIRQVNEELLQYRKR